MLKDLMPDIIAVLKPDGTRYDNLKAAVSRDSIIFDDVRVPLEEGDHVERKLPGGRSELYEVLETGFNKGLHGIPDFYNARVRKATSRIPVGGHGSTHVTLNGPNARVNVGSVDNSTNTINGAMPAEVFEQLLATLRSNIPEGEELASLEARVVEMQASVGTSAYNRAFSDFIQTAANWMTILGPFVPALSQAIR